jgi:tetratricopeptide (TPR) repeat protein
VLPRLASGSYPRHSGRVLLAADSSRCNTLATSAPEQSEIDSANRLFEAGKFVEAGKLYARFAAQKPKNYSATLQLGRIALLSNRLDDAKKWLQAAAALQPDDTDAKVMLAEAYYRRDDFQRAAASLSRIEVSTNKLIISQYPTLNIAKLESFKGQTLYEVHGKGQTTRLKFLRTDPLPLVSVRVNGGDEVTFFIDTGGRRLRSTRSSPRSLAFPLSGKDRAHFLVVSTQLSTSRALNLSPRALGLSTICQL